MRGSNTTGIFSQRKEGKEQKEQQIRARDQDCCTRVAYLGIILDKEVVPTLRCTTGDTVTLSLPLGSSFPEEHQAESPKDKEQRHKIPQSAAWPKAVETMTNYR